MSERGDRALGRFRLERPAAKHGSRDAAAGADDPVSAIRPITAKQNCLMDGGFSAHGIKKVFVIADISAAEALMVRIDAVVYAIPQALHQPFFGVFSRARPLDRRRRR